MNRPSLRMSLLALLFLGPAFAPSALAWGPRGHRVVGQIAERHLTPQAAHEVAALLAPEQLAYVTTWADEIRSEPEWAKADSWHWVTIPDGQTYDSAQKNPKGDVLEAISSGSGPRKVMVSLGYSAWGEGQLEAELIDNSWLTVEADVRVIFDTPIDQRYEQALQLLGLQAWMLTPDAGHA